MEPEVAAFGFGRRKCPGRYLAMDSLWIAMAYLLTCFNIEKPVDENGQVIEPSGEYTTGLLRFVYRLSFLHVDRLTSHDVL